MASPREWLIGVARTLMKKKNMRETNVKRIVD